MTILEFIQKRVNPDVRNEDELPFSITRSSIKKNDIITDYGEVENEAYYLVEGIVEVSINRSGDDEKIIDFFFANNFFCSYASFLTLQPSDVHIIALTDCVIDAIPREDLVNSYSNSLISNQLARYITEQIYLKRIKREKDLLTKPADERYLDVLKEEPDLLKHIPVNKVARYLGIHPESLSRIRKTIVS